MNSHTKHPQHEWIKLQPIPSKSFETSSQKDSFSFQLKRNCRIGNTKTSMLPLLRHTLHRNLGTEYHAVRHVHLLGNLKPAPNSTKEFKRVGRGPSSGRGKTSGRGQKGQKARGKVKSWFEGGQTPIYKLFPKIGFKNTSARPLNILNLDRITWFHRKGRIDLKEDEVLTMKKMKDCGLLTGRIKYGVKLLATGRFNYDLPWKIEASAASKKAIDAIEGAGGSFVARYFTPLSLKAHIDPNWFLKKNRRIPLPARPVRRKAIEYFSSPEKRGYLVVENDPYYQKILQARSEKEKRKYSSSEKKCAVEKQLEALTTPGKQNHSHDSQVMSLDEFEKCSIAQAISV